MRWDLRNVSALAAYSVYVHLITCIQRDPISDRDYAHLTVVLIREDCFHS